jgi:outer membrane protein OmpA-like peptidoglycan-associated protein
MRWTAKGTRSVDPLNQGQPVAVPLIAEYEYRGVEDYKGMPAHRIFARYASRFRAYQGRISPPFTSLQGTHGVDILIRAADGLPLMMRDVMDETFIMADGSTLRYKGFTLTFGEGTIPMDKPVLIAELEKKLEQPLPKIEVPGIDVEEVPQGVKLTIKDLRFIPDSDELLPAERPRLDLLARTLQQIPERLFLLEGHTAEVGRPPEAEMELSIQRAKRIADEMMSRGIPAGRFICKGYGSTQPLGNNSTDAGRRQNRRVEITILE